jgi:CRP-like cAMP-binding protein
MAVLSNDEKTAALAAIDFFAGCTERQRADIAHLAEQRDFETGEELCHQDQFDQHVFVIIDGEVSANVDGQDVGHIGAGEVVGEMAMLGDGHRKATLTALAPTRVLVLDAAEGDSVLTPDPHSQDNLGPRHLREDT